MKYKFPSLKRVGFFGGSFNPPHFGHLGIAKISVKKLILNKLFWLVVPENPFKKGKEYLPFSERIEACNRVIKGEKKMEVIDFESDLPTFETFETIKKIKRKFHKAKLFWLMGADSLLSFHKWRRCDFIAKNVKIVVFSRDNMHKIIRSTSFVRFNPIIAWNKQFHISSTQIRQNQRPRS